MEKIVFVGSKGGVGTSTVAVLHALSVAGSGRRVRLTATAPAGVEDLAVILAVPTPAPGEVVEVAAGLSLGDEADPGAYNVVDGGTDTPSPIMTGRCTWSCATATSHFAGPCWHRRRRPESCW